MADETRAQLAHLFRRAGFGARPEELDYYAVRGYTAAVDDLVSGGPVAGAVPVPSTTEVATTDAPDFKRRALRRAQGRWIREMAEGANPLIERMTLFLTDHFAASFSFANFVSVQDLEVYLRTVRSHALGDFVALAHALLEDPAFAIMLDAHRNRRGGPNENLAREFFELHTLGPGLFTETDVREAARALTGYKVGKNDIGMMNQGSTRLTFTTDRHDYGEKLVLGRFGTFMPHDVVDIAVEHPAAPRFVAAKLASVFHSPEPPASLVDRVANALVKNRWTLASGLRALFLAPEFRDPAARSTLVKSPAEFIAGGSRALRFTDYELAADLATACGQSLFEPPTVAGWTPNEGWLSTGHLVARYNAADTLGQRFASDPASAVVTPVTTAEWAQLFGMTDLSPSSTAAIDAYRRDTLTVDERVRRAGFASLVMSTPEFSLA